MAAEEVEESATGREMNKEKWAQPGGAGKNG